MKFKVLSNLKHDGKDYKAGDIIEIAEGETLSLVKDGILEEVKSEDTTPPTPPESNDEGKEGKDEGDESDDDTSKLEEILKKEVDELTEEEITILKDVEDLSEEDQEKFASVLE